MLKLIRPDASFTPRELFSRMQGAWLEPRIGSMWQETTGVTSTTSTGQTIGILLDQSVGVSLATAPLYSDISAFSATGGATKTSSTSFSTTTTGGVQASGLTIGHVYEVRVSFTKSNASELSINNVFSAKSNTVYVTTATSGDISVLFCAVAVTIYFRVEGAADMTFTSFLIRRRLGNHAYQATAANRPTLQFKGALPLIRHGDSNDVLVAPLPNLGSGLFSSAGSVYFSTPVGMSCLHNQSIGTSYNLPALQTDIYGTVITPARLAPPLEQRLALYMHRLAGLSDADFFWQEQATDGMTGQLLADDNDTILLRA